MAASTIPKKCRAYTFTLFDYEGEGDWEASRLRLEAACSYYVAGKEVCPETSRPHLQGYVYFKNAVAFRSVISMFGGKAHVEIAKGDSLQNFAYCSKGGNFSEFGSRPLTQKEKGDAGASAKEKEKARWLEMNALARRGDFATLAERFPRESTVYRQAFNAVLNDALGHKPALKTCAGVWIWGESGAGKSTLVRAVFKSLYLKGSHKWWSNYRNQPAVLWDDLGMRAAGDYADDLKRYGDKWEFEAEVKCGNLQAIRPLWFIITTQYPVESMWPDQETRDAINRRYKVIVMTKSNYDQCLSELLAYVKEREEIELDEDVEEIVPVVASPPEKRRRLTVEEEVSNVDLDMEI